MLSLFGLCDLSKQAKVLKKVITNGHVKLRK